MQSTSPFLVIGASTGLGRETAKRLGNVVTAGRSGADVQVDLRDLASVARAADELKRRGPFAGIVCNAGIQAGEGELTRSVDGFEETFAVNHLAHLAMVVRLAPAPGTRIAFIGSGTLDPDDRGARRFGFRGGQWAAPRELAAGVPSHSAKDRYATSKLLDALTSRALARRGLKAFTFDPGLMPGTGLARNYGVALRLAWSTVLRFAGLFMRGASSARRSGAALASLMSTAEPGYWDFHGKLVPWPAITQRDDWAEQLYTDSLALAGLADPFPRPA